MSAEFNMESVDKLDGEVWTVAGSETGIGRVGGGGTLGAILLGGGAGSAASNRACFCKGLGGCCFGAGRTGLAHTYMNKLHAQSRLRGLEIC